MDNMSSLEESLSKKAEKERLPSSCVTYLNPTLMWQPWWRTWATEPQRLLRRVCHGLLNGIAEATVNTLSTMKFQRQYVDQLGFDAATCF